MVAVFHPVDCWEIEQKTHKKRKCWNFFPTPYLRSNEADKVRVACEERTKKNENENKSKLSVINSFTDDWECVDRDV
mgnify:CR=1 FL=1